MNLPRLKKVKRKTLVKKVDFIENSKFCKSVIPTNNGLKSGLGKGEEKQIKNLTPIKDVYTLTEVGEELFAVDKKFNLYRLVENRFEFLTKTDCLNPVILSTNLYMQKTVMISVEGGLLFLGEKNKFVCAPVIKGACIYNGKVFAFNKNTIYLFRLSEVEDDTLKIKAVQIGFDYGKICGLVELSDNLYVICKNKILRIYHDDEFGFTIKETKFTNLNVVENTIQKTMDGFVFVSDNNLCEFKNSALKTQYITGVNFQNGVVKSGIIDNAYLLDLTDEEYAFCYNLISRTGYFINKENSVLSNGLTYLDVNKNRLKKLGYIGDETRVYLSKEMHFDIHDVKVVKSLIIDTKCDLTIRLSGDFGSLTYSVTKGYNVLSVGKQTKTLQIEIQSKNQYLNVSSLSVEIQKQGE